MVRRRQFFLHSSGKALFQCVCVELAVFFSFARRDFCKSLTVCVGEFALPCPQKWKENEREECVLIFVKLKRFAHGKVQIGTLPFFSKDNFGQPVSR